MASAKQIEANRLNALLSTGPKTNEGKAIARRNALTHGLAGAGIVMPIGEDELVEERAGELCVSLKPLHTYDLFLTEEIALEQLRAERCRRLERARRQRLAENARDRWEEDRVVAAEQIGAQLSKEPALRVRLLEQTVQGCDWLLSRWHGLGRVLEGLGAWSDDQRRLALDLLGTPRELRNSGTPLDPRPFPAPRECEAPAEQIPRECEAPAELIHSLGDIVRLGRSLALPGNDSAQETAATEPDDAPTACMRAVADAIERLSRLRDEVLEPRDEAEQRAAFQGEGIETDPELQLLRRYEASIHRRKSWALKNLNKSSVPGKMPSTSRTGRSFEFHPRPSTAGEPGAFPAGERDDSDPAPFLPPISGGAPEPTELEFAPPLPTLPPLPPLPTFRSLSDLCRTAPGMGNRHARRAHHRA